MRFISKYLLAATVALTLCCFPTPCAFSQSVADWKITGAPTEILHLVSVNSPATNASTFTFKNTTTKTIIEFLAVAPDGSMTGVDAFTTGSGAIDPGGNVPVTFGNTDFQIHSTTVHNLRIAAVVYSDGSHLGSASALNFVENEMLGAALETKRILSILATNPDPSAAGLTVAVASIESEPQPINRDSAESVKGIALSGLPQSYIDTHVNSGSPHLIAGMGRARQCILSDIRYKRFAASQPISGSSISRAAIQEAQSHGLSDLTQKYKALNKIQTKVIRMFKGISNAN